MPVAVRIVWVACHEEAVLGIGVAEQLGDSALVDSVGVAFDIAREFDLDVAFSDDDRLLVVEKDDFSVLRDDCSSGIAAYGVPHDSINFV